MKFSIRSRNSKSETEPAVASSVESLGNCDCELFGCSCSDTSDCEICETRVNQICYSLSHARPSVGRDLHQQNAMEPLLPKGVKPGERYRVYGSTPMSDDSLGPADFKSGEILDFYKRNRPHDPLKKKQSSLVTIFSVWNTMLGSSLLAMAWGVGRAGLVSALLLTVAMGALCLFTAHLLLTVKNKHGGSRCEVPALCRVLLGRWAELLAHAFSLLVLLGANIVYWILVSNFLYFTVNYIADINSANGTTYNSTVICPNHDLINGTVLIPSVTEEEVANQYWGLHTTVPIYVAVILFPLLNFRSASFFTKFNSLGTLSVVYLLIFVAVKGLSWGVHEPVVEIGDRIPGARDAAVLSGMLALSFYIHNIIITIMSNNARQDKNGRDLTIAFLLVTMTYGLVGAVFYICFPLAKSCIEDNILNNFEMHDVMTAVARALLLFQDQARDIERDRERISKRYRDWNGWCNRNYSPVFKQAKPQIVTVYPLLAFMLRSEAILLLPIKEELKSRQCLVVAINLMIVTTCILFACFCPSIGTIIRYTGAVSGLVHVFALPSLLQLRSLQLRGKLTSWRAFFYVTVILFGTINFIMQFFISDKV